MLEAGRSLTLAEKGGAGAEEITAAPAFCLVATMNPGGDFGKRELSPALANRFTSVWVPPFEDMEELSAILRKNVQGKQFTFSLGLAIVFPIISDLQVTLRAFLCVVGGI